MQTFARTFAIAILLVVIIAGAGGVFWLATQEPVIPGPAPDPARAPIHEPVAADPDPPLPVPKPEMALPPAEPEALDLRQAFTEGETLNFTFNTLHATTSSVTGTTEGAVLRLVVALTHTDEAVRKNAAGLLSKGGAPVLEVLVEYVTHEASREERRALAPIIKALIENPEAEEEMPDRFIVAEREGRTQCSVDWTVETVRGANRATVHVKTNHITVRAKQRTLGMDDYEHATFVQGVTRVTDPHLLHYYPSPEEPDNPIAAMFFHAMNLDYHFTMNVETRDILDFRYGNENAEAERKAMNLKDPLQIGASFRRFPRHAVRVGEEWEVIFRYIAGASGYRVHICTYKLEEVVMRQQRRCARVPWTERIYSQSPRASSLGERIGGGTGEFWMDVDAHVLVFHSQQIAFENATTLRIPKKNQPDEIRNMDTFFATVLKTEMRLNRITRNDRDE